MKSIVLTGGGTAGHVFGNLALLPLLQTEFDKIYYIGSNDGIERKIVMRQKNIEYISIPTTKLVRKLTLKNLLVPFKLLSATHKCTKILKQIKPNIIFSKGGFVSVPVCLAANRQKIPIILHESDISLGLANKLIKNKTKVVCTAFPSTAKNIKNGIFCGPLIREELFKSSKKESHKKLNIKTDKPVLLVVGGSLGAQSLNELVWSSLNELCNQFFVVHITGKNKTKNINQQNYKQIEFANDMQVLYAACDYALTRGGSNALFELLSLKIPMLISPLKKQTRGEQILNAKYFCEKGFAITLEEETKQELLAKLVILKKKEEQIKQNMNKYSNINSNQTVFNFIKRFAN